MNRRTLLSYTPPAIAALLVGCTTTRNGKTTTITLNVATMNAWGQALVNGAMLVAGLTGVVGTPVAVTIGAVAPIIQADMEAFNKATNGSLVFTFDATSPATIVTSLVNDAQTLANDVAAAVPNLPGAVLSVGQEYLNAIKTIVSLLQATISSTVGAPATPMSEDAALRVLKVQ